MDGCKGGWFSVGIDRTGGFEMKLFCSFRKLLDYYGGAKLILVDIPIGLPEGKDGRDCDRTVRRLLSRPQRSSVFPTPTRLPARPFGESPTAGKIDSTHDANSQRDHVSVPVLRHMSQQSAFC